MNDAIRIGASAVPTPRSRSLGRRGWLVGLLIPVLLAGWAGVVPARAQGDPDAAAGVVEQRCATCHEVAGFPEPTRRHGLDAPSFQAIVDNSSWYTRTRLLVILRDAHFPMNSFVLSTTEVNNVIAYIESLRGL